MLASTHVQIIQWPQNTLQKHALTCKDNPRGAKTNVQPCSKRHEMDPTWNVWLCVRIPQEDDVLLFQQNGDVSPPNKQCDMCHSVETLWLQKCPPGYSTETHRRFSKLCKNGLQKNKKNETKPYHHAQIRTGRSVNEQLLTREWCRTKCNHDYKCTPNLVESMWFHFESVHVTEKKLCGLLHCLNLDHVLHFSTYKARPEYNSTPIAYMPNRLLADHKAKLQLRNKKRQCHHMQLRARHCNQWLLKIVTDMCFQIDIIRSFGKKRTYRPSWCTLVKVDEWAHVCDLFQIWRWTWSDEIFLPCFTDLFCQSHKNQSENSISIKTKTVTKKKTHNQAAHVAKASAHQRATNKKKLKIQPPRTHSTFNAP